ncbi:hypothetical protein NQ318_001865 [Aromia moschata]|uniref:SIAH-type domain-containing protein n=1 Tax=Aromia moschata TaxID=1265417 RepID=A0AAV8Z3Y9_9CUCU|nr:hypothetical protein NQ318_001865 [Aromia moschata]
MELNLSDDQDIQDDIAETMDNLTNAGGYTINGLLGAFPPEDKEGENGENYDYTESLQSYNSNEEENGPSNSSSAKRKQRRYRMCATTCSAPNAETTCLWAPWWCPPDGRSVCGRCPAPDNSVHSLYNTISKRYFFKCVHYQSGCNRVIPFNNQYEEHENTCRFRKNFECPCCPLVGNGCQLVYHFKRRHVNSVVRADTLEKVLSYHELKNYVDAIKSMNSEDLRLFLCTVVKLFLRCCICNNEPKTFETYLCPNCHVACSQCIGKTCPRCKTLDDWDKDTDLHRIYLQCEWPECNQRVNMFNYLAHKRDCKHRRYKCPSKKCNFRGCLVSLQRHWHLNSLINSQTEIYLHHPSVSYWLTPLKDILRVTFDQKEAGGVISIINEDVISDISFQLSIYGDWKYKVAEPVRYVTFAGRIVKFSVVFRIKNWGQWKKDKRQDRYLVQYAHRDRSASAPALKNHFQGYPLYYHDIELPAISGHGSVVIGFCSSGNGSYSQMKPELD